METPSQKFEEDEIMSYTIASMEDVHNDLVLDFGKNGNKYTVSIYNKQTKELTHKEYTQQEEAINIFDKVSRAILTGCYSEQDRRNMID